MLVYLSRMRFLFNRNFAWLFAFLLITAIGAGSVLYVTNATRHTSVETALVTRGKVQVSMIASGKVKATNVVQLSFPTIGSIKDVYKSEGDHVIPGEILASLTQDSVVANYNAAVQNLQYLQSIKNELVRGPRDETRQVTQTNLKIAEENLTRTKQEQTRLVQNALETLRSTGLEAVPALNSNNDTPPTITGNYLCEQEGTYTISVFSSDTSSGYSYHLTGLEDGTFAADTDVAAPLGTCGLYIQFSPLSRYRNGDWIITIPNIRSSLYLTNLNTYKLALQQQANALAAATQALTLAQNTEKNLNARASLEDLKKADANIEGARAVIAAHEAQIQDYVIRSPFAGIVTHVSMKIGEIANSNTTMQVMQEGLYELKARIPEVDIAKITQGTTVTVSFDAKPLETIPGTIGYISPFSTNIDGVSYYEATILLQTQPDWIREGMNADIRIVTQEKNDVLVLPKRFIASNAHGDFIIQSVQGKRTEKPVTIGLTGTDGSTEIKNIPEGTEVILP